VDSQGKTLEYLLSVARDAEAAKRFFSKALIASHTVMPRVITVNKNAAYPKALSELKAAATLPEHCELRQVKYLTTSSSKTIVLSNDSSNQRWASYPLRAHGERYKGPKA
jgi:transposase-like protein